MKKLPLILFYLVFYNNLFSQQIKVVNDIGFWGGINIEKKLSKDFEINLEQQIRLHTNATEIDDYIVDFGGKYKMNKNFKFGANLRYVYNNKRLEDAENNYRYNLDLLYKGKLISKLKLYYRFRYQHEYVYPSSVYPITNIHYSGIRNKIRIQYRANDQNDIYISGELFRLLQIYREPYFKKIRFYVGDNLKTKIGRFNLSLGYEQEINTNHPLSFFFIKAKYTLEI